MTSNAKRSASRWTTGMLLASMLAPSPSAWALTDNTANPNSVNMSALKAEPVNCQQFCDKLVGDLSDDEKNGGGGGPAKDWTNTAEKRKVLTNTSGGKGWSADDDLWCANHGYPTDPKALPATKPKALSSSSGVKSCNVQMVEGDKDCAATSDGIFRCMMYGSQVVSQCLAYKAVGQARSLEYVMAGLDLAATISCGAACATGALNPVADTACQAAGIAAGATEIASVFALSNSPVASYVANVGAAAGGVAVGVSLANGGNEGGWGVSRGMTDANGGATDATNAQKTAMCTAAVIFGVTTGVRLANMATYHDTVQKSACEAVQSLASEVLTANAGPGGTGGVAGSGYTPGGIYGSSAGSTGSVSTLGANNLASTASGDVAVGCTGGTCAVPTGHSSTTDGGILTRSGLDKAVGPKAAELAQALSKGASPAQLVQQALGGGTPEMASALSGLTAAAQSGAPQLAAHLNLGSLPSTAYAAGGGSGSGGKSAGGDNPFANLFGAAGTQAAGSRVPATADFGGAKPMDIWHTGTTQNIFEIVSEKVSHVTSRVSSK